MYCQILCLIVTVLVTEAVLEMLEKHRALKGDLTELAELAE